jgi:hypothetical protein
MTLAAIMELLKLPRPKPQLGANVIVSEFRMVIDNSKVVEVPQDVKTTPSAAPPGPSQERRGHAERPCPPDIAAGRAASELVAAYFWFHWGDSVRILFHWTVVPAMRVVRRAR